VDAQFQVPLATVSHRSPSVNVLVPYAARSLVRGRNTRFSAVGIIRMTLG